MASISSMKSGGNTPWAKAGNICSTGGTAAPRPCIASPTRRKNTPHLSAGAQTAQQGSGDADRIALTFRPALHLLHAHRAGEGHQTFVPHDLLRTVHNRAVDEVCSSSQTRNAASAPNFSVGGLGLMTNVCGKRLDWHSIMEVSSLIDATSSSALVTISNRMSS